jgi:hypothetical protein
MSMFAVILALGAIGALVFFVGIAKGASRALRSGFATDEESEAGAGDSGHYGLTAAFAVIASAVVIALAGVAPGFIYLGPLLAIGTATGVGAAFLVEDRAHRRNS